MFTYQLTHHVSHAEVDFVGEQKLSAFLGMLERAAVEASAAAGYDAERYAHEGKVWLVRRTLVARFRPAGGTTELQVTTRVADVRRARSLREYRVESRGVLVAEGVTDWVYCDLSSLRPARIPSALAHALAGNAEPACFARIPSPPTHGDGDPHRMERDVLPSHLDHVGHVNNAEYANFLEDAALKWFENRYGCSVRKMLEQGRALRPQVLDIEYFSEASAGETLEILTWPDPAESLADGNNGAKGLIQCVLGKDGRIVARSRSVWIWRQRAPILGSPPLP